MNLIWGPLRAATDTGPSRQPVSRQTGGIPPAAGLAPHSDTTPDDLWLIWMTCVHDGLDHAVTDAELTTGQRHDNGLYQAACGYTVTPQAMIAAPGRPCTACRTTLDALRPPAPKARWRRWLSRIHELLKQC